MVKSVWLAAVWAVSRIPSASWRKPLTSCLSDLAGGFSGNRSGSGRRVTPLEAGKAREMVLRRTEPGAIFDCQFRQMRVGRQIPACPHGQQQITQYTGVPGTRLNGRHRGLRQPGIDDVERGLHRKWATKKSGARGDAKERQHHVPR